MKNKKTKKRSDSKTPQISIAAKRRWLLERLMERPYCLKEDLIEASADILDTEVCDKTLKRWIEGVEADFNVDIIKEKDPVKGMKYSLSEDSKERLNESGLIKWMIDIHKINESIQKHLNIRDKILEDDIPSAGKYLDPILEAISYKEEVELKYPKYSGSGELETYILRPYCVKLFEKRWYVIGLCPDKKDLEKNDDGMRKFSLDIIQEFKIREDAKCEPIKFDEDFDAKAYFDKFFGIFTGVKDKTLLEIQIKVFGNRVRYFRELPLHHTQKEINTVTGKEPKDSYSIFQYKLIPADDFYQALLHHGEHIEVLSPESVRNKMRELIQKMAERYGMNVR